MNFTLMGRHYACMSIKVFEVKLENSQEIYSNIGHVAEYKMHNICERKQQI
jgi:hypothetical protein